MGITYDELKKLNGNSVVLERQENIEIEQNANNLIRRKHTVIREKFPRQESKGKAKEHKKSDRELKKEPLNEIIARVLLSSFIAEREEHKKIEEKLDSTTQNLNHLKEKIQYELKDLKQEQSLIKMSLKPEVTKRKNIKNLDKTWSENLRNNESFKKPQEEVIVDRYSKKHKCVCISPRYTSNEEVAVRPKMRTIGSQMGTTKCYDDRGAVGDRISLNAFNLNENKALNNTKELLVKTMDPSLTKAMPKDFIVNCCTCCVVPQPACQALCQRYCRAQECNGVICNQQRYQETGVTPQRQYNYCRDEFYYDYPHSCQQPPAITTATNKIYGRPCSDLNTEYFCCRKTDRTASPKTDNSAKSKRDKNSIKKNEASGKAKQNKEKEKKESKDKECRCMETCEEYALRKLRECEEKQKRQKERSKSRERSKSTDRKDRSKSRDAEEKKLRKLACEKILNESGSKLVELFDRFADGKDTSIGKLFRYLADAKTQLSDESSTTLTSCHVRCEEKSCQVPIKKKCTCPKHSANYGLDSDDNRSRKSQLSMETLQMLKQMKLREYKPSNKDVAKTRKSKTKTKEATKEDDEKSKRYNEYINKYRQEDEDDKEKQAQETLETQPAKTSKQQPQSSKHQERPDKNLQNRVTDDEDVIERYEYGPAVGNGWDDYGRTQYNDDTQISQNQNLEPRMTLKRESIDNGHSRDKPENNEKSKQYSTRTSQTIEESKRQINRQGDTYASNGDERGSERLHRSDVDRGPRGEDERLPRRPRQRNNDQTPGNAGYVDEDSLSPEERKNRYQNPSSSRGTYPVYQDEPSENLGKPGKLERESRRGTYEVYGNGNQTKPETKYQDAPLAQSERGNRRGTYDVYENGDQTKPQTKYQDAPSERGNRRGTYDVYENPQDEPPAQSKRGNRYENPSPSRGSYEAYENRHQTKPATKYKDESSVNLQKPGQSERGNRYQSPSGGSYEAYEKSNQKKPAPSEYDNYPIKQEEQSQRVEHKEEQRSQQQRQDEAKSQQQTPQESTTKLYSSYDDFKQPTDHQFHTDGSRRNDPLSKPELTDQESFRTYTKSTEMPKAEQRAADNSREDTRLIKGLSGSPTVSQLGYIKYKQKIKTNYTQDDDGTEVTHINEKITIDESFGQPLNTGPTNTEEAIRYLKGFLDSYEKYGFEDDCLKSVSNVTNDLINKLSACTTTLASSSARSENYAIRNEQPPLIDETKSTETQYKDLESTSNVSPIVIKQEPQATKEEAQTYLPPIQTPKQNVSHGYEERNGYDSKSPTRKENSTEQTPITNLTEQQQVRPQESFANNTYPQENDRKGYETVEQYRYCERQTQSDYWVTEENYETLTECRDINPNRLHPPEEFTDAQSMLDYSTAHYVSPSPICQPNEYMATICPPPPMLNTSNNDSYCLPECSQSKYNNTPLPCSSRVSQKSCCCNSSNTGTSSGILEETPCDRELLPKKGILKPCRVKNASASTVCDFENNKTTSTVCFGNEEQIKTHNATSRMYNLGPEKISQLNDENIDTLITKDESQRPLRKQSTITRCETKVKQPIYDDCHQIANNLQSCTSIDAQPLQYCQSAQQSALDETIPRFTQCPCMLDTYLKLLELYCKEEDKFDFIKR